MFVKTNFRPVHASVKSIEKPRGTTRFRLVHIYRLNEKFSELECVEEHFDDDTTSTDRDYDEIRDQNATQINRDK